MAFEMFVKRYINKNGIEKSVEKYGVSKLYKMGILESICSGTLFKDSNDQIYNIEGSCIGKVEQGYASGKILVLQTYDALEFNQKKGTNEKTKRTSYLMLNSEGLFSSIHFGVATKIGDGNLLVSDNVNPEILATSAVIIDNNGEVRQLGYDIVKSVYFEQDKIICIVGKKKDSIEFDASGVKVQKYVYGVVEIKSVTEIKELVPCEYDTISHAKNGLYVCESSKKDFIYALPVTKSTI